MAVSNGKAAVHREAQRARSIVVKAAWEVDFEATRNDYIEDLVIAPPMGYSRTGTCTVTRLYVHCRPLLHLFDLHGFPFNIVFFISL
jgi:hypothetical protein